MYRVINPTGKISVLKPFDLSAASDTVDKILSDRLEKWLRLSGLGIITSSVDADQILNAKAILFPTVTINLSRSQ